MIAAFKITKRMAFTYHQLQITHNLNTARTVGFRFKHCISMICHTPKQTNITPCHGIHNVITLPYDITASTLRHLLPQFAVVLT